MRKIFLTFCLLFCIFFISSGQSLAAVHPVYKNNPWKYTLQPVGNHLIWFVPQPSQNDSRRFFCVIRVFDCVSNFWFGNGYVEQCLDNQFDKFGGTSKACKNHKGVARILYWQ